MDRAAYDFKKSLNRKGFKEVSSLQQCHFLLFFCPIISRAGTDIDAAVKHINQLKASSFHISVPVIMVVLHHTFDPEKLILDSNNVIASEYISAVDCLFDDNGLLAGCQKNTNAINTIARDSELKNWTLYHCLRDQYGENEHLIHERPVLVLRRTIHVFGHDVPIITFFAIVVVLVLIVLIILLLSFL
ncbi:uncharacterized protein LOC132139520 isoform X2 [Carassius carassius]|nr:uncharacterized protein LOC132139520 isoform X2 [Carassius carassius]XP_059403909.1 uncharacterized protein LOC132139520 isoform X2 [Carassius carassius]XP_059403910.1 uncharacterized protein LOC132139520 isoform X2 [Carassius carassius]